MASLLRTSFQRAAKAAHLRYGLTVGRRQLLELPAVALVVLGPPLLQIHGSVGAAVAAVARTMRVLAVPAVPAGSTGAAVAVVAPPSMETPLEPAASVALA